MSCVEKALWSSGREPVNWKGSPGLEVLASSSLTVILFLSLRGVLNPLSLGSGGWWSHRDGAQD